MTLSDEKRILIEALKKHHNARFTPGVYEHSIIGKAALMLENSVELVHARNLDADFPSLFKCSQCGWSDCDTYTGDTSEYNYCPNCGAKMDGDGNGC
jgi:hypothetical protein